MAEDSKKKSKKKNVDKYINIDPVLDELYYLQPDGKWINNADGRSEGKTKSELLALGVEEDLIEARAPLTVAQRRARGRTMRRFKSKIAMARKRAARRKASPEKLKNRARKKARKILKARLSGGKDYGDMSPAEKMQLDKRLLRIPDTVINRIATRQLPAVRRAELDRLSKKSKAKVNEDFEAFLEESNAYHRGLASSTADKRSAQFRKQAKMDDDDPSAYKPAPGDATAETKPSKHTKRFHMLFKKEGTVNCDRRFKMYRNKPSLEEGSSFISEAEELMETVESLFESKEAVQKKAEETGIPYSILKKVYDRGIAAWKSGHRPGTTPIQWGLARVNSFATGGKTRTTADSDLWKQYQKTESADSYKADPSNREHGTKSLVDILKKDTPGQKKSKTESYFDADLPSSYGSVRVGDEVSFKKHNMDLDDDDTLKSGIVIGSNVSHLRIRDSEGTLYRVRHADVQLKEDLNFLFEKNFSRKDLPQLDSKDMKEFLNYAKKNGVDFEKRSLDPSDLEATQKHFHKAKIQGIVDSIEDGSYDHKPILVSNDFCVLDGHHRWMAHKELDLNIETIQLDLACEDALDLMHDFPKSFTKKLYEDFDLLLTESGEVCPVVTQSHMKAFETLVDRLFAKFNIDFDFTKHFRERMSDGRNNPCIDIKELAAMIQKIYKKKAAGSNIFAKHRDTEVVLKDIQSDLNMPVALEYDRRKDELRVAAKTIMRKKNFKSPDKEIRV